MRWRRTGIGGPPIGGTRRRNARLGKLCRFGKGVTEDIAEAVRLFRRAADQDHADSMIELAALLHGGTGVAKNQEAAVSLLQRAARQRHS